MSQYASLRRNVVSRYGSLEAYAEALVREETREIERSVNTYVESYNLNREENLRAVYEDETIDPQSVRWRYRHYRCV